MKTFVSSLRDQFRFSYLVAPACLSAVLLAGCSDPSPTGPPRVKTVPVKGRVVVDGGTVQLPKQVMIQAHLNGVAESGELEPAAFAVPEGDFSLSTYETGDGVPVGEYTLTFRLGQRNLFRGNFEGDDFKGKYADAKTAEHKLSVTGNETGPIDLGTIELSTK
ncbi:MAG: hypothetical protein KF861_14520 [Planctomycetaceae bacterium]|nr:hypothetical protein [Planctomycetaceae bacterium]